LVGLAESFRDEANLDAQPFFRLFAALNAMLDQQRMEEPHEGGVDRSCGFRGTFDLELAPSLGGHCGSQLRLLRRTFVNLIGSRFDPEPHGLKRRQEQQNQHRADGRAADQRVGHRSPENGMREGRAPERSLPRTTERSNA
jgi:hypothetical protein